MAGPVTDTCFLFRGERWDTGTRVIRITGLVMVLLGAALLITLYTGLPTVPARVSTLNLSSAWMFTSLGVLLMAGAQLARHYRKLP